MNNGGMMMMMPGGMGLGGMIMEMGQGLGMGGLDAEQDHPSLMPFMGECGGLHMDTVDSSDSLSHFMDHTTTTNHHHHHHHHHHM